MKKIFSLLLTLTMVLSLAACGGNSAAPSTPGSDSSNTGSDTASDSDTIKIGYVSDLTGATALWGTAGQYGAELAIKQVNENGGVLDGKMLELVPMDGKGEPADSVSAFKNLVEVHNIVAEIGTNFSSCNIPNDIAGINLGSVYESAVAQELKAHYEKLFYYGNKQKGEVDFPSAIGRLRVAGLGALVNVSPISALDASGL